MTGLPTRAGRPDRSPGRQYLAAATGGSAFLWPTGTAESCLMGRGAGQIWLQPRRQAAERTAGGRGDRGRMADRRYVWAGRKPAARRVRPARSRHHGLEESDGLRHDKRLAILPAKARASAADSPTNSSGVRADRHPGPECCGRLRQIDPGREVFGETFARRPTTAGVLGRTSRGVRLRRSPSR